MHYMSPEELKSFTDSMSSEELKSFMSKDTLEQLREYSKWQEEELIKLKKISEQKTINYDELQLQKLGLLALTEALDAPLRF